MWHEGALANDASATVPCDERGGCGSVVLCERDGTETFGRTVNSLRNLHGKGRTVPPVGGLPRGLGGCCFFLETAKITELQKI